MSFVSDGLAQRLVRYADLIPCRIAPSDLTTAATEQERFTIIAAGIAENPDHHVHIVERHGFTLGGARQPFGCVTRQRRHDTAQVFIVHSGRWRLLFGPNREDGALEIGTGDVASAPIAMFRGVEKIDEGIGFLFTVLGEDDPGAVTWPPAAFDATKPHGFQAANHARPIDTAASDAAARDDAQLHARPTQEQAERLATPVLAKLAACVARAGQAIANPASPLAGPGVTEAGVIVPCTTDDGFDPGPIIGWWPHGFNLRLLTLATGAYVPMHARREAEVLIIQSGNLEVSWAAGSVVLGAGDTFSVPVNLDRAFRNAASVDAVVLVIRSSENPARPIFRA